MITMMPSSRFVCIIKLQRNVCSNVIGKMGKKNVKTAIMYNISILIPLIKKNHNISPIHHSFFLYFTFQIQFFSLLQAPHPILQSVKGSHGDSIKYGLLSWGRNKDLFIALRLSTGNEFQHASS